jgi:hypothetical protein
MTMAPSMLRTSAPSLMPVDMVVTIAAPAETGTSSLTLILIGVGCGLLLVTIVFTASMLFKRRKKTRSIVADGVELQAAIVQEVPVATAIAIPHSLPVHIPMAELAIHCVTDSKVPTAKVVLEFHKPAQD